MVKHGAKLTMATHHLLHITPAKFSLKVVLIKKYIMELNQALKYKYNFKNKLFLHPTLTFKNIFTLCSKKMFNLIFESSIFMLSFVIE